jgi:hypothetical protein
LVQDARKVLNNMHFQLAVSSLFVPFCDVGGLQVAAAYAALGALIR